jgi:hypothetical protein
MFGLPPTENLTVNTHSTPPTSWARISSLTGEILLHLKKIYGGVEG